MLDLSVSSAKIHLGIRNASSSQQEYLIEWRLTPIVGVKFMTGKDWLVADDGQYHVCEATNQIEDLSELLFDLSGSDKPVKCLA